MHRFPVERVFQEKVCVLGLQGVIKISAFHTCLLESRAAYSTDQPGRPQAMIAVYQKDTVEVAQRSRQTDYPTAPMRAGGGPRVPPAPWKLPE